MHFKEQYRPYPIAANGTLTLPTTTMQLGGFIATTAGTITIVDSRSATLLNAHPVTAGQYLPLPMALAGAGGCTVTLAGGASGCLLA